MLSLALIATAGLLALAGVFVFRTRNLLSNLRLRRAWLRFTLLLGTVTSFVLFFGVSSIVFKETSELGIYLLPPCFAALFLSLSLLVRQTLTHLRHLYQRDGLGIFDQVTGVHNRYYLEQRLEAEIARSKRYNTPLALISVEVNDYEALSDEYGHQAGDMAASLVAKTLKLQLRETDVVTRYQPGCFILILPDTPERNVYALITRLERVLNKLVVIKGSDKEQSLSVTVKFGISTCTLTTGNAQEMIDRSLEQGSGNRSRQSIVTDDTALCEVL